MLVGMIPATTLTAFAAAGGEVYVGGVGMANGTYPANNATSTTTSKPSGGYAYYADGVLTLHNYTYSVNDYNFSDDDYACVYTENDLKLVLEGTNSLTGPTYKDSNAVYVEGKLTIEGTKLTARARQGIYAGDDITINSGEISVTASASYGICADLGTVNISGGTIAIIAYCDGICAESIAINGGTVKIEADDSGIYAYYDVNIKDGKIEITARVNGIFAYYGDVNINGGTVKIEADGRGIYAYDDYCDVNISGGTIEIIAGGDGIFAYYGDVNINGGTVKIEADVSGIYAYDDYCTVNISGGTIEIIAGGDGIYANDVSIEDGTVTVKSTNTDYDPGYWALNVYYIDIADTLTVQASTTVDGELGEYVAANHNSYKKIVIEPASSDFLLGDINGDGEVNAKDSNLLKQMIAGSIEYPAGSRENLAADINGDGEISAKDSNLLKQMISGAL